MEFKGKTAGMKVREGFAYARDQIFNLRLKRTTGSNSLTSFPDKDPFLKGPNRPLRGHDNDMYGRYGIWKDKHHSKGQVRRGKAKARTRLRGRREKYTG